MSRRLASTARLVTAALVVGTGSLGAVVAQAAEPHNVPLGVTRLDGVLHLAKGSCDHGRPSGSYLAVTYGTKAIRNRASRCGGGAVTLLDPGRDGLSTRSFSPVSDQRFDAGGNAVADAIAQPARFDDRRFGIVTAARNLQDEATGPRLYDPPRIYLTPTGVVADVRSVQVLYGGVPGSTCATAEGYGCWVVGVQRATGSYDPNTRQLSLSWFTGQSFVAESAGTVVHLSGQFAQSPGAASRASAAQPAGSDATAARAAVGAAGAAAARGSGPQYSPVAESPLTQIVRSPDVLLAAALLVGGNAIAVATALGRRRR